VAHSLRLARLCRRLAAIVCLCAVGCLPRARINAACRWTDGSISLAALGDTASRAHLMEDVRVANDLGIRYADASAGRMNTPAWHRAQASCTERSIAEIMRLHRVSRAEIGRVASAREIWIDLLAVFLPLAVLFLAASRTIVARIVAEYDRQDRGVAAVLLAVLAPLAAGTAVALAQIWGVTVEQLRLRDDHISYRAFDLPARRHGWALWAIAMALFAAVIAVELRRKREPTGATVLGRAHRR
jgi:hypothetical protein